MIDISTLKIVSNIPVPESRARSGMGLSSVFKQLKTGDSVFIPFQEGQKASSLSSQCHTAAKNSNIRATIRKVEECPIDGPVCKFEGPLAKGAKKVGDHTKVLGFRVWRVDDPADLKKPSGPRVGDSPRRKG